MEYFKFVALVVYFFSQFAAGFEPISEEQKNQLLLQFDYTPIAEIITKDEENYNCKAQVFEYDTRLPLSDKLYRVRANVYLPETQGEALPVVFILPTINGADGISGRLDRAAAKSFCRNKIASVHIQNDFTGISKKELMPVSDHDEVMRRAVGSIKGGLAALQAYPSIDLNKVGIFGASLGGILGAVAAGVVPEIKAASFIVSGGDVPAILANSEQRLIKKVREARMKEQNFETEEEYEAYLNMHITLDPLHFVSRLNSENLKLYISLNDKAVPTLNQLDLYLEAGTPQETKFYKKTGHALSIIKVLALSRQKKSIASWFLERLNENERISSNE